MKRWIGLALLVLVVVGAVNSSKFLPHQSSRRFQQQITVVQQSKASTTNAASMYVSTLKVSRENLLAHIRALNYRRYTEAERDRTRAYLAKSLKQLGWKPELQTFEGGVNIFAQRQGTDAKAGSILVGAHYDTVSVSPGADDNATGVAVVLEVARLLGSRPTPRTLQLALFDREELGLLGSRAFVADEKHLENLQGAIVMDMVGFACHKVGCQKYPQGLPVVPPSDKGDFLAVVGDMEHATLLDAFQPSGQDSLPPVLTLPVPLKGMLMPDTLRSDHAPFWYRGVGAVLLTDTANLRTPHYHQPTDTPATLDKSFFTASAQLVVNATTKLLEARSPQVRG
jgi:Zn-dependent M28 family amino/carboxypeptidase